MPRLTREKKGAIYATYLETKSYVETATIQDVDWRTVKAVVREYEESNNKSPTKTHMQDSCGTNNTDHDLEVQLKANELFETETNVRVSKILKLRPNVVMDYRKQFNAMLNADLDEESRKKRVDLKTLEQHVNSTEQSLRERQLELKQVINDIEKGRSELETIEKHIRELETIEKTMDNYQQAPLTNSILRQLRAEEAQSHTPNPYLLGLSVNTAVWKNFTRQQELQY